tara:strand:+ start:409 stop:576 length:168 start_codon:yes stop_codon:yes gene_type:complete
MESKMTQKNIFLSPVTNTFLDAIVLKRKNETGVNVTKKAVVAELINAQYKKEIKE